jgi:hypothetical protein
MEPVSLPEEFTRWNIVIATGMAVGTLLIIFWQAYGFSETGMLEALNASGQLAFFVFLVSFLAWPLYQHYPNPCTYWMVSNQYYIGISLIIIYTAHAIACLGLKWGSDYWMTQEWQLVWKIMVYVMLSLATLRPFRLQSKTSVRRWHVIQSLSMYGIWAIFQLDFFTQAQQIGTWYQWSLTLVALVALIIRVKEWPILRSRFTPVSRFPALSLDPRSPQVIYSELPSGHSDRSDLDITIAKRVYRRPGNDSAEC